MSLKVKFIKYAVIYEGKQYSAFIECITVDKR